MGLFGNSEKKREFTLENGGNEANGGRTLPDVEINSPRTFQKFGFNLEPKNGEVHSMSLRIFMKTLVWKLDTSYASVEGLTSNMQKDGYEIVDIKMIHLEGDYFQILIIYK